MRRLLIFLFLTTFFAADAQLLPIRNYTMREGLNAYSISALLRDSKGMLWVGTYNGVNIYDGQRFQQPQMSTRSGQIYVTQFTEDKKGQIWIGSWYSGLYKYAGGVFTNYLPDTANISDQANSILHETALPDGTLLVGTDHNAYIFDGQRFTLLDAGNPQLNQQITATACMANGDILIGSDKGLLEYRNDKGVYTYAGVQLPGIDINAIVVAGEKIWVGTDKGLYQMAGDGYARLLAPGAGNTVFLAGDSTLWYTSGSGIWRLRPGGTPEHFTRENGLPSSQVICGCTDAEGIIWLGTDNGLAKLTPAGYRFFPVQEAGEVATIIALAKDENHRLWAGSYGNLFQFDGAAGRNWQTPDGHPYGFIYALLRDSRHRLWICASSGVYCKEKGVITRKSPFYISSIAEDSTGTPWFGGQDGRVLYCEKDQLIPVYVPRDPGERIAGIWRDGAGVLWIGRVLAGVQEYSVVHDSLQLLRGWDRDNGYPRLLVRSLRDDHRGHLLAGTRTGGLFVIPREGGAVLNISREQGLSGNWIKDIIVDNGQVYLATNNGLDVLATGRYSTPARHISFNDDRVPTEFNTALLQADTLWLGTSRGVLEYSLHSQQPDSLAPPVRLLKLAVNGQVDSGFRPFTGDTQLSRLSYTQNNISVDFAALSFREEDGVRYRYRLEGLDTGWNPFTDRRYVNYMNLAPGNYRFLVEARNNDGLISRQPAAIRFIIAAPFWQRSWFILLCILVLLGVAYGFYRYRLHQALAIERLRARISTDLHDDTGSTLSSISILSDMALQEEGGNTAMLKEIRDNSLSLLEKMDDIVWSINPRNDTLESLMLRVKRFAAQLFEARGIEYEIDIEPEIRRLRLLMDHRQNLYLIMKEAINNLVKYSNAEKASIHARYSRHHLVVQISDDGNGFSPEAMATGNGIINMRNRAAGMKAELDIRSGQGEGTTVTLSLKIS